MTALTAEEIAVVELAVRYPWPEAQPTIPPTEFGWFNEGHEVYLREQLPAEARVIVELGSWMGRSTRFFCRQFPHATVIAVDHWKGSREHQAMGEEALAKLYDTFLASCWEFREQIIPLRANTLDGLREIHDLGIIVDAIYIDAAHDEESVYRDTRTSTMLFPKAKIVGDDWPFPDVEAGARRAAGELGLSVIGDPPRSRCWRLVR